jgi:hypothetical protein
VSSGSFAPPADKPISGLPVFCRVAGVIRPSADSNIEFEVWMPAAVWNRKLQGVGNGGFAGSISYDGLGRAIGRGYAAASTDTGHKGAGVDATWALGHPEKIVDFGHRAIHEMTVKARAVVEAYYGEAPRRSYFASCSNGGRQALMEAQRHPADYDGIVAGAPAAAWTAFLAGFVWNAQAMADPAAHILPPSSRSSGRSRCDAPDGADSILAHRGCGLTADDGCKAGLGRLPDQPQAGAREDLRRPARRDGRGRAGPGRTGREWALDHGEAPAEPPGCLRQPVRRQVFVRAVGTSGRSTSTGT